MKLIYEGRKWVGVWPDKWRYIIKVPPAFGRGKFHAHFVELKVGYAANWADKVKLGWGPVVTHARPS